MRGYSRRVRTEIGTASTVATAIGKRFVAGDHVLELVYPGNAEYGPATAFTTFTVLPAGSVGHDHRIWPLVRA